MAASEGLTLKIEGMRAAKAAFQALPETVRDGLLDATETTARELVRHAQARLASSPSIQTRALYDHVAWSINRKNGRAKAGISTGSTMIALSTGRRRRVRGIITAGAGGGAAGGSRDVPSQRAHFIEFGTRHMPAEPFMMPAAEAQKSPYLQRVRAAGRRIERDASTIGQGRL